MEISSIHHNAKPSYDKLQQVIGCCPKLLQQQQDHEHQHHEQQESKKLKPPPTAGQALKCPRCDSINTKFCYYNNYSLSQPRYFCKGCRRYWTNGGSLRNVPVGGGSRKNKRTSATTLPSSSSSVSPSSSSSSSPSSLSKKLSMESLNQTVVVPTNQLLNLPHQMITTYDPTASDQVRLSFSGLLPTKQLELFNEYDPFITNSSATATTATPNPYLTGFSRNISTTPTGFLDVLKTTTGLVLDSSSSAGNNQNYFQKFYYGFGGAAGTGNSTSIVGEVETGVATNTFEGGQTTSPNSPSSAITGVNRDGSCIAVDQETENNLELEKCNHGNGIMDKSDYSIRRECWINGVGDSSCSSSSSFWNGLINSSLV